MSPQVPVLVPMDVQAPGNRVVERSIAYFLPLTVGQRMAVVEPDGTGVLAFTLGKLLAVLGSTPATNFFQLLMPSPDGQALESVSRLLTVPNQRRRHASGMPSP